jgi:hypothetical protein
MADDGYRDGIYSDDDRLSALTAAPRVGGQQRGVIVNAPIVPVVGSFAVLQPSLRLDDGSWIIRAARLGGGLVDPDELAHAPGAANPTFPFGVGFRIGVGGIQWTESHQAVARGSVLVKQGDMILCGIFLTGLATAEPERILLTATKHLVNPVRSQRDTAITVPAGGSGTFAIPQGATRFIIYGLPTAPATLYRWLDAAGAGKDAGTATSGTQSSGLNTVPPTAASLLIGPLPTVVPTIITVVWEVFW